ncbi:hypothetical protein [Streptomyces sp. NPDC046909]|uniref:hypothetical protein n=1 Tax=Streptomyces sp. NPDC046909 TaxID=3155617 RepID=UPI0033DC3C64
MPAAAAPCKGDFSDSLDCWTQRLGTKPVTLPLRGELPLGGTKDERAKIIQSIWDHRQQLSVEVPAGVSTGEGGTVLLVLAEQKGRLVDRDAMISRLSPSTREELASVCTADRRSLCDDLVGDKKAKPMNGEVLIQANQAVERHAYITGATDTDDTSPYGNWLVPGIATLLALLLAALFVLVRRTRVTPAPAAAHRMLDEPTRALRPTTTRTARHRSVTPTGPTHPAVVRTDLHPQGYVEVDRVLYRAVWADPGQAPPPPGSRVDVTDPPEPDSDVLYAFPPAAGRHAHAR